jgi:hypothetical protein
VPDVGNAWLVFNYRTTQGGPWPRPAWAGRSATSVVDGFVQAFRFAPQVPLSNVPEPGSAALVLLTLALLVQRRTGR